MYVGKMFLFSSFHLLFRWHLTSRVAVQAPDDTTVSVTGGLGVGPVASPDEHCEVGARQAMSQTGCNTVVVMLATGVLQGLLSPGRVPRYVVVT